MKVRVEQFEGQNGPVKNQFLIHTPNGIAFQSYNSIIAYKDFEQRKTYLDERYWDYSKTTGKYRNIFLRENKAETERKIKEGRYIFTNLNNNSFDFGV